MEYNTMGTNNQICYQSEGRIEIIDLDCLAERGDLEEVIAEERE